MSTEHDVDVACPHCGHEELRRLAVSVNAGRSPRFRDALLSGRFHHFVCAGCGREFPVDIGLNWIDFDRHHWLRVFPAADRARWRELASESERTYEAYLVGEQAPRIARKLGEGMLVRTVFGLGALREKILCWDAGLDDRVLVVLEWAVWRDAGRLVPLAMPRFEGQAGDRLLFRSEAGDRTWEVPRTDYHAAAATLARDPAVTELLAGPLVDPHVLLDA